IVATAHGWTGNLWRERAVYYPIDKRLLRRFDAVIGVSAEISQELIRHGVEPSRVSTLLNGVDPQKYLPDRSARASIRRELGLSAGDILIGSVGRVERQKRFDLLIDAFAELAPRYPRLRLAIIGEGSLLKSLREKVDRLGLADRCQLLGHQS